MFNTDSILISTSYGEVQRALVNVGSTILQNLFKDALKAFAILGLKMESRSFRRGDALSSRTAAR